MKLLTEKKISDKARDEFGWSDMLMTAYVKGAQDTQRLLLESASENFDQWIYKYHDKCDLRDFKKPGHHFYVAEEAWQACSLHHAKKMQEKDAEIERLKKENGNLRKLLDNTNDIRKIEFETFLNLKKENEELRKDFERIKGVAQENYNRAEKINETRTEEIKKLQKEIEELRKEIEG